MIDGKTEYETFWIINSKNKYASYFTKSSGWNTKSQKKNLIDYLYPNSFMLPIL